jgi:hypothetical protein
MFRALPPSSRFALSRRSASASAIKIPGLCLSGDALRAQSMTRGGRGAPHVWCDPILSIVEGKFVVVPKRGHACYFVWATQGLRESNRICRKRRSRVGGVEPYRLSMNALFQCSCFRLAACGRGRPASVTQSGSFSGSFATSLMDAGVISRLSEFPDVIE